MVIHYIGFLLVCAGYTFATQGGSVYLINLSGSDWKLTGSDYSTGMQWHFPDVVKNNETYRAYVEYFWYLNANAWAEYELVGTGGKSFRIVSGQKDASAITIVFTNLEIDGKPKGSDTVRHLGWNHDGDMNVIIINRNGSYTGSNLDASNWMKNNIWALGGRTLKELSIPGSHDSGMNRLDGSTAFGYECNVVTQSLTILKQLENGIRYFDIRPVIGNGGKYLTGHYTHVTGSFQGGNGQDLDSIISEINEFTKNHNELIILYISHTFNTDVGANSYREFNKEEYEELYRRLDTINNLYDNDNSEVNLQQITLNDYTKNGSRSAVVIIVDTTDVHGRMGKGYFLPKNINFYDDYSHTSDWEKMVDDQINKLKTQSTDHYFILNWILTQANLAAAFCTYSVKGLAEDARKRLGHFIYEGSSTSSVPNVLLIDNVLDSTVTELAVAINYKL